MHALKVAQAAYRVPYRTPEQPELLAHPQSSATAAPSMPGAARSTGYSLGCTEVPRGTPATAAAIQIVSCDLDHIELGRRPIHFRARSLAHRDARQTGDAYLAVQAALTAWMLIIAYSGSFLSCGRVPPAQCETGTTKDCGLQHGATPYASPRSSEPLRGVSRHPPFGRPYSHSRNPCASRSAGNGHPRPATSAHCANRLTAAADSPYARAISRCERPHSCLIRSHTSITFSAILLVGIANSSP